MNILYTSCGFDVRLSIWTWRPF